MQNPKSIFIQTFYFHTRSGSWLHTSLASDPTASHSFSYQSNQTFTCRCELQTPHCDAVGSTAVVAVVKPDKLVFSNCGDSRAVLCWKGVAIPLSSDHKVKINGSVLLPFVPGDNYLKPYVISEPEVTVTERTEEDECLILASDGLWDVVSNEIACGVVRMCLKAQKPPSPSGSPESDVAADGSDWACSDASILLTKLALARHSSDNVSVVHQSIITFIFLSELHVNRSFHKRVQGMFKSIMCFFWRI